MSRHQVTLFDRQTHWNLNIDQENLKEEKKVGTLSISPASRVYWHKNKSRSFEREQMDGWMEKKSFSCGGFVEVGSRGGVFARQFSKLLRMCHEQSALIIITQILPAE